MARRRTMLPLALVIVLLAAPATAQVVGGGFRIEAEPAERTVDVGEVSRHLVVVRNGHHLDAELRLEIVDNPSDVSVTIDPPSLHVPAGGSDSFAVSLALSGNAAAGSRNTVELRAQDATLGATIPVEITLVAATPATPPAPAPRPGLALVALVPAIEAVPGDRVTAAFTVENTGDTSLHVLLDLLAPDAWGAVLDAPALALAPHASQTVQAFATIPAEAGDGTENLTLAATSGSLVREASTLVRIDAPARPEPEPEKEPAEPVAPEPDPVEAQPPTEGPRPRPVTPRPVREPTRLTLLVTSRIVGPAGGVALGTVTLLGGDEAARLSLAPHIDIGWPAELERSSVDVPARGRVDLWLAVRIPADAEPGSSSEGLVLAETNLKESFARGFVVETVETVTAQGGAGDETTLTPHVGSKGEVGAAGLVVRDVGRGFEKAFEELAPVLLAGGTGLVAGLGLIVLGSRRETWRIGLASLLAPLYTRLERPGVLGHPDRVRILDRIAAEPGLHFRGLQRALDLHTGALVYHLRVLERHRLLASRREGHLVRYFPAAGPRVSLPALRGLRAEVMHALAATPGLTQREVADRVKASKQAVHYHVKALIAQGLVRMDVDGGLSPARASESQLS